MNIASLMMGGARIAYAPNDDTGSAPAADPAPTPAAGDTGQTTDTGTDTGAEAGAEGAETGAEGADGAADPAPKPKKPLEDIFKGRVGHLTKQLAQKDEALAAAQRRAETAERLLEARGASSDTGGADTGTAATAPAPAAGERNPETGRTYTEAEIEQVAEQRIAAREFNKAADESYKAGKEQFPDWEDAMGNLRTLGIMNRDLLDAALATDAAAPVLHHLGKDPEEAARIVSLPPARMGAELAKLAVKLSSSTGKPVSGAPDPITPITGRASPTVDLERAAEGSMADYAALRAKQGATWAQSRVRPR